MERFIKAQKEDFNLALNEIKSGKKKSHYMWYIFPQLKGLGKSYCSEYYGLDGIEEAIEYCNNDYLYNNLITISKALLELENNNIESIVGHPDDLKLKSSMTLFYIVTNKDVFKMVIDKYYDGILDETTINILNKRK